MNEVVFSLILLFGAILAGFVGALTGLGGGIIIVPLLTLALHVPIKYAVAASLISVIGTSSGAAAAFVKEGITNMRIGMFLEIATTIGAIFGALIVLYLHIPVDILGILFGIVLIITAALSSGKKPDHLEPLIMGSPEEKLKLYGSFPNNEKIENYSARNFMGGFALMVVAGMLSGLLGIGGGVFKVLAMDNIMRLPFKVSTTTSNFMIGVTAAASAIIYFSHGFVLPAIAGPVLVGVVVGSIAGSRVLMKVNVQTLRKIFAIVVAIVAVYMIYNGFTGKFDAHHI